MAKTAKSRPSSAHPSKPLGGKKPLARRAKALSTLNFKPWQHAAGEWAPPSNADWAQRASSLLPPVRLAWLMLYKTKPDIEIIVERLSADGDALEDLMEGINSASKFFDGFSKILKAAEARLIIAAASYEKRTGKDL